MELNHMTNHTTLKPKATEAAVQKIIDEAKEYNFLSVCINPCWVAFASEQLAGTDATVCTVIGFPLGTNTPEVRACEVANTIRNGAGEVDMVISIDALKSRQYDCVRQDIQGVVDAAKGKVLVKVVIETTLLADGERVKACELAKEAGTDFVRTSTGFSTGGAEVADIHLMRETVGPGMGVKASDGVHNTGKALATIKAGATRIGASTGVAIVSGAAGEGY